MRVTYEVTIAPATAPDSFTITWRNHAAQTQETFAQGDHLLHAEELKDWERPAKHLALGHKLFHFLDGDAHHLQRALDEANQHSESLLLYLRACSEIADWPFELLAHNNAFLLPTRLHLLRRVSERGAAKTIAPHDRGLKLMFMACSALDVAPELDFEREEEAIFQITNKLAIDIEVEDSGSLPGLRERLATESYDIVHLSGHADIDAHGNPFFIMENETGRRHDVSPKMLWQDALKENLPRLLFLSGCRTGETPGQHAAVSFAQHVVENFNVPAVLGWGRSVADQQAMVAEEFLYYELSRGHDLAQAVQRVRQELRERFRDSSHQSWPLLRLYTDATPPAAFVTTNQKPRPQARQLTHTYLKNSQVRILETGFVGRRRQIQRSLQALKNDQDKIGVLLHGAGGLGKSCLAGKLCERFSKHTLIIIHGRVDSMSMKAALHEAFIAANDEAGLALLQAEKEMPDKLAQLCATRFKAESYLFVLDDFEKNLEGEAQGQPGSLLPEAVPLMTALLHHLPKSGKMTQLLLTSRYPISLTENGLDLAHARLENVSLTGFTNTEQNKKGRELPHIWHYPNAAIAQHLLAAGHGNPRLMEWLDALVAEMPEAEVPALLAAVADKQEKFVQQHVLRELLVYAGPETARLLRWCSAYRLPVAIAGPHEAATKANVANWQTCLQRGIALSLIEYDQARATYQIAPLLRAELWVALSEVDQLACHEAAFAYYTATCGPLEIIAPQLWEEWIHHALICGREEVATREGGRLISFLGKNLAYREVKRIGEWVLAAKQKPLSMGEDAFFLNEFAHSLYDLGEFRKAVEFLEQALNTTRTVYGEAHHTVVRCLNDLGSTWKALGEPQKAISFYEQALKISRMVFGVSHQQVALCLNNLGAAWDDLGEQNKAITFYEQALPIYRAVFGDTHPNVAAVLNNLGSVRYALGEHQQAIVFYEQALAIDRTVYAKTHPILAMHLNNLGSAWDGLGESHKAIGFYQEALEINRAVYGETHLQVAINLSNLGSAWHTLGENKRAIAFYEQALSIDRAVYGETHPSVARDLNNLGLVWNYSGEHHKALTFFEQALIIDRAVYSEVHPEVATSLNNLGEALRQLGELRKAIALYEQAVKINRAVYGEAHPQVAINLNNLGLAWYALDEHRIAIGFYEIAVAIYRAAYGEAHPDVARCLNNMGSAYFALEEKDKAKKCFEASYEIFKRFFGPEHPNVKTVLAWLAKFE